MRASALRLSTPSPATIEYTIASLRMAGSLAVTDEVTVSVAEIRLVSAWLEALDQVVPQSGSAKICENSLSRKSDIWVSVMLAAAGSSWVKPNLARKAASMAALGPASKAAIGACAGS